MYLFTLMNIGWESGIPDMSNYTFCQNIKVLSSDTYFGTENMNEGEKYKWKTLEHPRNKEDVGDLLYN